MDFSKSFIQLLEKELLPSGNSVFLVRAILLLVENIIGIRNKQFSKKELILASRQLIFWLVGTIFFFIFQRLLPVIAFFGLLETSFSTKSFILDSG